MTPRTITARVCLAIAAGLFVCIAAGPLHAATWRVTPDGTGDGTGWDASASSLTNALTQADDGDTLWIADGTYDGNTFNVTSNNLTLYGGFTNGMATLAERDWDAYEALLDGENTRRVMEISATGVTLDGLVITNGSGSGGGGILVDGAYDLSLLNCTVIENDSSSGTQGGGARFTSSATVTMSNTVFALNGDDEAIYGGGEAGGFFASSANITITDCLFTNNGTTAFAARDGSMGGAFYMTGGSIGVTNTTFVDNKYYGTWSPGDGGGAARLYNVDARFVDCLFLRNRITPNATTRDASGGALVIEHASSDVTIQNCLFVSNYTTYVQSHGGAVYVEAGTVGITNCTFVNNTTDYQGGSIHVAGGTLTVANSIFDGNSADTRGDDVSLVGGSATFSYCRLDGVEGTDSAYDQTGGLTLSNIVTNDPLFASATDYHLKSPAGRWTGSWTTDPSPFSPCIDAGDPGMSVGNEVAPHGSRINQGRYGGTAEASKSTNVAPVVENRAATTNGGNVATMRGELVDNETIAMVSIYYGTNPMPTNTDASVSIATPQQTGTVFSATLVGLQYSTTYYCRSYATNAYGEDWANTASNFTTGPKGLGATGAVIHVKADATGGETGDTWDNAYTSLKDGAAAVTAGTNEIWVAAGTYDDATVDISATCTIYGGFDGTETNSADRDVSSNEALIDGGGVRRCMNITGGNVVLDGLVISNALHSAVGNGLYAGSGVDLQLLNCTFTHNEPSANHANGGGAALVSCSAFISNCLFDANQSASPAAIRYEGGGGLYANAADVVIVDSVFSNNGNNHINSRDGNNGGGIYAVNGSLAVTNTTFVNNGFYGKSGSYWGGGGARLSGVNPARFTDCLFKSNYVWTTSDRDTTGGGLVIHGGGSAVLIEHCIFDGNYCANTDSQGGALAVQAGTVSVTNCTFANNWTDDQGGAIHVEGGTLVVKNSIFYTNTASIRGHDVSLEPAGSATISYCRAGGDEGTDWIYDGAAGITTDNIITDDPRFAAAVDDYHLRSQEGRWDPTLLGGAGDWTTDADTSLCIDAGEPGGDITYTNEPTPHGGRVNLGRYGNTVEASKTYAVAPIVTNIARTVTNNYVTMQGKLVVNDATATIRFYYGFSDWVWEDYVELAGQYSMGTLFSNSVGDLEYDTNYYFRAFATNSVGTSWASNAMMFTTGSEPPGGPDNVIHVKAGALGSQSGVTWFDACPTLLDGLAKVDGSTNEIWAASGVVQGSATLTIATNVSIYGGFGGETETTRAERDVSANISILDGEGARQVVEITDGTVRLDGLTVSNGHAQVGAGIKATGYDLVTIANCRVIDNHHGNNGCDGGGAYFSGGSVLITNSTFADNSANWGGGSTGQAGGISANSVNMVIVDSLFSSNSVENAVVRDGGGGGGIRMNGGTLAVTNTTFIGNRGNQGSANTKGGGAAYLTGASTARFKNCAFIDNRSQAPTWPTRLTSGGALNIGVSSAYTVTVENCSIAYGSAYGYGGAIIARSGTLVLKNSILWTNQLTGSAPGSGEEIYVTGASTTVTNRYCAFTGTNSTYVDVASGTVWWGPGIITGDPLFASSTDLHLQSSAGRWDPTAGGGAGDWVTSDTEDSPCIDAGDDTDDVGDETAPNGDTINMGAYGGTDQASRTAIAAATGPIFILR